MWPISPWCKENISLYLSHNLFDYCWVSRLWEVWPNLIFLCVLTSSWEHTNLSHGGVQGYISSVALWQAGIFEVLHYLILSIYLRDPIKVCLATCITTCDRFIKVRGTCPSSTSSVKCTVINITNWRLWTLTISLIPTTNIHGVLTVH